MRKSMLLATTAIPLALVPFDWGGWYGAVDEGWGGLG